MTRVLVAPDKFKGSLTASEVAEAVRRGLLAGSLTPDDHHIRCLPVADGGDGTLDAAVAAGFELVDAEATGPDGAPVRTAWARRDDTALVELAAVSGLSRLRHGTLRPMVATSRGTGELIAAALDSGAERIVLGIGGSACTDGGIGMVQALGAAVRDAEGRDVGPGGAALENVHDLDLTGLHPRLAEVELVVACDVDNPLTGPAGAAAIYGPQKGATPQQVHVLDQNLGHLADLVAQVTGEDRREVPGAGAAGGVGFAAIAMLSARLEPGIHLMLDLLDFGRHLRTADLVVVGEGALDRQSLHGKAPVGVARLARAAGSEVVAVCGVCDLEPAELEATGISACYSVADVEPDHEVSMRQAAVLLERIAAVELVRHLSAR